ncbi:MAG: nicotinate-nucleotide pyrophosphorylase (carboxylating) [Gammaproteobacteria bacterium]|jgi:nicotinate-nucleotide pyrophosphorylase (carboxylating)
MIPDTTIIDEVRRALSEDIGSGDISASLVDPDQSLKARLLLREPAVLCGTAWFDEVCRQCNPDIQIDWKAQDGDQLPAETIVCYLSGPAGAILTAERSALNFLQTLSGTATTTRHYVNLITNTRCRILDTRKTIPNLRLAQKYAVRCGGGTNHRIGLFDAFLIKENHLAAAGSIAEAVTRARALNKSVLLEVEVESLGQLDEAVNAGVDRVLLDNFSLTNLKLAVERYSEKIELEASGNITDESLVKIAATGVNYVSIGALTKHLKAIDYSLRYI